MSGSGGNHGNQRSADREMDSLTAFAASWEIAVTWVAIARRDNLHCDSIYKDCVCLLFAEALDWEANAIDLSLGMINALIDY